MNIRKPVFAIQGMPVEDGAGVKLNRILGQPELDHLDPFLLLDEFKSENKDDYSAGFPPHPHRGFETVTYMKKGKFKHKDSRGNEGSLVDGSVQWMTAGRGIIHSEMPMMADGLMWGYQLWVNLPAKLKMTEPGYQDISPDEMPVVEKDGHKIKIISGSFEGTKGPARNLHPVIYYDLELKGGQAFQANIPEIMNVMAYVYSGSLLQGEESIPAGYLAVFGPGDTIELHPQTDTGLILVAAEKIGEPIARGGPFVMNTREELAQAFEDFQSGKLGKLRG